MIVQQPYITLSSLLPTFVEFNIISTHGSLNNCFFPGEELLLIISTHSDFAVKFVLPLNNRGYNAKKSAQ